MYGGTTRISISVAAKCAMPPIRNQRNTTTRPMRLLRLMPSRGAVTSESGLAAGRSPSRALSALALRAQARFDDPNSMQSIDFTLRGDHITLDALLKASGIVSSGGAAKVLIAAGGVRVNGAVETRRGRKLRAGDEVVVGEHSLRLRQA